MRERNSAAEELERRYPQLAPCREQIQAAGEELISCFSSGGKLLVCGNGGSAADAEHIVGELMKGFERKRPLPEKMREQMDSLFPGERLGERLQGALPAIALNAHTALGTAWSNDRDPSMGFAQQVWGYGRAGDLLLALSTSGSSQNVGNAVKVAKAIGLRTVGISGAGGGLLRQLCDVCICLPEERTFLVQELTLPVYHELCKLVENHFWTE